MKLDRVKTSVLVFTLSCLFGVALTFVTRQVPDSLYSPLDGGPLGYRPQLVSSATSPDGTLLVKVFRQRNPSYSWYVGAEMFARIYDNQGTLLYEQMIGSDGAWSEVDNAFEDIKFEDDVIRISQLWGRARSIKRSELKR